MYKNQTIANTNTTLKSLFENAGKKSAGHKSLYLQELHLDSKLHQQPVQTSASATLYKTIKPVQHPPVQTSASANQYNTNKPVQHEPVQNSTKTNQRNTVQNKTEQSGATL